MPRFSVPKFVWIAAAIGGCLMHSDGAPTADNAKPVLEAAASALGAENLRSIEITGRGYDYLFGQAYDGDSAWPKFNVPRYKLSIDYTTGSLRDDRTRTQGQSPPLGGGNQPINEQHQIWALSGNVAWNEGEGGRATAAGAERDQRTAVAGRQLQILLTPQGFVQAALGSKTAVVVTPLDGGRARVAFTTSDGVKLAGTLNAENLPERIETWLDSPVIGDTLFDAVFEDYREFNGIRFPARIVQSEGGYPVLNLTVTDVKPNATVTIQPPASLRNTAPTSPETVVPEKVADGIWRFSGPAYQPPKTFAVEFKDYIVAIEAPDSEERSIAVIDAIKKTIPNKPIRYIVNTHTHFDHSGGLRTYVAEGATVITYRDNIPYYEQVWANPRTIHADRLAKSGRKPVFEGISAARTLSDGSRELVIYHYAGNMHNSGMLMIYFPQGQILIEADSFNPAANPADPPTAIPNLVQFYDAVTRLGLSVKQITPIHGRATTMEEARKVIESYRGSQLWQQ